MPPYIPQPTIANLVGIIFGKLKKIVKNIYNVKDKKYRSGFMKIIKTVWYSLFTYNIDDQEPDTLRFIKDCEKALGMKIDIIQSKEFKAVEEVCRKYKYINGPYGAKCTTVLKKQVREKWERENLQEKPTYIWGYDLSEKNRADRITKNVIEANHKFPLIENGLTKEDCHALLKQLGIKRPRMYELGYHNNNCVGCLKGGKGYWNKIRQDFPEVFKKRAELEREVGASCINGIFLDELDPDAGRNQTEILEDCSLFCQLILNDTEVEE